MTTTIEPSSQAVQEVPDEQFSKGVLSLAGNLLGSGFQAEVEKKLDDMAFRIRERQDGSETSKESEILERRVHNAREQARKLTDDLSRAKDELKAALRDDNDDRLNRVRKKMVAIRSEKETANLEWREAQKILAESQNETQRRLAGIDQEMRKKLLAEIFDERDDVLKQLREILSDEKIVQLLRRLLITSGVVTHFSVCRVQQTDPLGAAGRASAQMSEAG